MLLVVVVPAGAVVVGGGNVASGGGDVVWESVQVDLHSNRSGSYSVNSTLGPMQSCRSGSCKVEYFRSGFLLCF